MDNKTNDEKAKRRENKRTSGTWWHSVWLKRKHRVALRKAADAVRYVRARKNATK